MKVERPSTSCIVRELHCCGLFGLNFKPLDEGLLTSVLVVQLSDSLLWTAATVLFLILVGASISRYKASFWEFVASRTAMGFPASVIGVYFGLYRATILFVLSKTVLIAMMKVANLERKYYTFLTFRFKSLDPDNRTMFTFFDV